jgi:hypothetical protein
MFGGADPGQNTVGEVKKPEKGPKKKKNVLKQQV